MQIKTVNTEVQDPSMTPQTTSPLNEVARTDSPSPPVQVWNVQKSTSRKIKMVSLTGMFMMTFGLAIIFSVVAGHQPVPTGVNDESELGLLSLGLILHVIGLMGITASFLFSFSIASSVRFTVDSVVISQTFRRDIALPFHEFSYRWMIDRQPCSNIRIIMLDANRGCTIHKAPPWVHECFHEIDRIQRDEGWYNPGEVPKKISSGEI